MKLRKKDVAAVEMQMGPMIDMVFLLLFFFMVSAKPIKQESDVNIG
ncbi:MAG: ExbD/TolR family protein, partial [Verrucomicrobiota bacterium]